MDECNLIRLDPFEFESLIAQLLKAMGLAVEQTKKTGDGGIDVLAYSSQPIVGGHYVVQCKRYAVNNKVDVSTIRDLFGVVTSERASKGVMITTSGFTQQAKEFACGKPLELIDGTALTILLRKYQIVSVSSDTQLPHTMTPSALFLVRKLRSLREHVDDVLVKETFDITRKRRRVQRNTLLSYIEDSLSDFAQNLEALSESLRECSHNMDENPKSERFLELRTGIAAEAIDNIIVARDKLKVIPDEKNFEHIPQMAVAVFNDFLNEFSQGIMRLEEAAKGYETGKTRLVTNIEFDLIARVKQIVNEITAAGNRIRWDAL